jgi:DNA-binding NarL/FixJ family response regulator
MLNHNITVALVEDDPVTHARLCAALRSDARIDLRFTASSGASMLAWLATHEVDVLLVDLGLPDISGLEVIAQCGVVRPQTEVMVVTMFGDESNMIRAFEAGASGYLLKDASEDELAEHVQTLHAGGSPMSPLIARQLLLRMGKKTVTPAVAPEPAASKLLTDREETVLKHLARGYSYGDLAKQMGVSINTIQTHIRGLYAKLKVHSKSEAIFEAKQLGLLAH